MDQRLILLHAKFFSQKGIKINMPSFISQLLILSHGSHPILDFAMRPLDVTIAGHV
jgi:hypothetical protein